MAKRLVFAWLGAAAVLLLGATGVVADDGRILADVFFYSQDAPVLVGIGLAAAAVVFVPAVRDAFAGALASLGDRTARAPAGVSPLGLTLVLAAIVLVVGWTGTRSALAGFPLSMDEFMASFDAGIFRHREIMAPMAPFWRPFAPALQPMFILLAPGARYWSSAYLPMNAAFRALAASPALASLVNPAWSAVAVVAVFGVGCRLWPEKPMVALAAATLLATSSQLLVMAMTAYAMPAHLALNLLWLWLVLRGGRLGNGAAAGVAFVACGLHQLVFHPLFAAPFVLQLWLDRRWGTAIFHTTAYAAICLFWISYWTIVMRWLGFSQPPPAGAAPGGFVAETLGLISSFNLGDFSLMAKNLARLITWQNPLTAPLAILGFVAAVRSRGMFGALAAGVVFMAAAVFVLLAFQGYGWGYRYLHGALGSTCLLAAWQWDRMTESLVAAARRTSAGVFLAVGAASLVVLLPLRLWQAGQWAAPYAAAGEAIARTTSDVVLVDETGIWFGRHLVRNDPYLTNRPRVLDLGLLDDPLLRRVCAGHTVALFDHTNAGRLGLRTFRAADVDWPARLAKDGCRLQGR